MAEPSVLPGASLVKRLVSKKKLRYQKDGFDLDLSYITPRIISMGFPSTGAESYYRNPAKQVQAFIEHYHKGHCKVYNLCIEKSYNASVLGLPDEQVEQHGCFDHNPAPLICIQPFCESAKRWLDADPQNVVAVHCKAGKGRTGMMISALMVYMGEQPTAEASLRLLGKMRTANSKGVTIPSQQRYVGYTERLVAPALPALPLDTPPIFTLSRVVIVNAPEFACDAKTSFTLELVHQHAKLPPEAAASLRMERLSVSAEAPAWQSWKVYDHHKAGGGCGAGAAAGEYALTCPAGQEPLVAGDVKLVLSSPKGKLTQCWFHTSFLDPKGSEAVLSLSKLELDKVCKDKKDKLVPKGFGLRLHLRPLSASEVEQRRSVLYEEISAGVGKVPVEVSLLEEGDEDTDDDDDDDVAATPRPASDSTASAGGGRVLEPVKAVVLSSTDT